MWSVDAFSLVPIRFQLYPRRSCLESFHSQDVNSNFPCRLLYNPHDVSLEKFGIGLTNNPLIDTFIFLITCWQNCFVSRKSV